MTQQAEVPHPAIRISVGDHRRSKNYRNIEMQWQELKDRCSDVAWTNETTAQYAAFTKEEREKAKDHGGFVGGWLKDGRRKKENMLFRSVGMLDADNIPPSMDFISSVKSVLAGTEYFLYSTHSHTKENQRYRIAILFSREVTCDEYPAIMRMVAKEIGIDCFDDTTYEINRMMYWPTCPADGEFIFAESKDEVVSEIGNGIRTAPTPLDVDAWLAKYEDWHDISTWPVSSRVKNRIRGETLNACKQQDPLTKTGIVGDFCRAHTISSAIKKYLSDIYETTTQNDRYDFIAGQGRCGVVVYEDKFAYSHHATDPASGKLLNAFDLVRVHLFRDDDESLSYKNMCELALHDEEVLKLIREEKQVEATHDFTQDKTSATQGKASTKEFGQHSSETDWEEPVPLVTDTLPDFPINALTPTLRNYSLAVAETTQTAVDMAAVGTLAVVSAAMRNVYKVEAKPDWQEPTNIYCVSIAEPSERKTANIAHDTKPVDEYVREYNAMHKVEFEMSRVAKQRLENRKNSLISASRKKGKDESAEDFDDNIQEVVEQLVNFQEKKPLRIYVDDTTPEKLVEILAENNNAISIISSEGGIFDILSGAYSNKVNIDVFLKGYSGERITVERIMRESVSIDDACLTILLSVQPVVIGDLMKNSKFRHRGLTARFLYSHPKSTIGEREFDTVPISPEIYGAYKKLIYNILDEKRGDSPEIIRLTEEAKPILKNYYDWVETLLVGEYSAYNDWIGKLVGNTLRIAGILARSAVLKNDVGEALLEKDEPIFISAEIMTNAIEIGKYFLAHAIDAYSVMGVYTDFRSLSTVVDKLREKQVKVLDRRGLMRLCRWISSAEDADNILTSLEDYGYIRLTAIDLSDKIRGGRPKNPTYSVNPRIM